MIQKLIDLLMDTLPDDSPWAGNIKGLVDHLIANGVTFAKDNDVPSKWIPVSERLPENIDTYLVVVKYKYDFEKEYSIDTDVALYNPYEGGYIDNHWNTFNDWDEGQQYLHVTHWMPMPKPPEEG